MRSRYYLLVSVFGLAALIWSVYLFSIQILDPFNFAHLRRVRYIPRKEILIPRRGAIHDINGNLLVSSISFYQVDIDRKTLTTWASRRSISLDEAFNQVADVISTHSSISRDQVLRRLNLGNKLSSIQITNKISEAELDKIIRDMNEKSCQACCIALPL